VSAEGISPHSGGTVPDSHRVPSPFAYRADPIIDCGVPSSRILLVWLPVVLWAGLIFGLSSVPDLGTGLGTWDLVFRKIAHFCEYAILGALLLRALGREVPTIAVGVAYAATDELHQHFVPGRHAAVRDVAIDAAGVLAGVLLLQSRPWSARR
jgi:VanZ family protein